MAMQDWQRHVSGMINAFKSRENQILHAQATRIKPYFASLVNYYQGVPAETARFTRDQEFLKKISQTINKRIEVVNSLDRLLPG